MSGKTSESLPEEIIRRHLSRAGYGEMTPLQREVFPVLMQKKDLIIVTGESRGKTASYVLPLLDKSFRGPGKPAAVIITPSSDTVQKVDRQIRLFCGSHKHRPRYVLLGENGSSSREHRALSMKPHVVIGTAERIIDHIRRNNISFDDVETVVIDISEKQPEPGFDKDILFILSKISRKIQTVLYAHELEGAKLLEGVLKRPQVISVESPDDQTLLPREQETEIMKRNAPFSMNEKELENTLKDLVRRIRKEENPDEMDAYKKAIRKHVPFTLRAYVGACLLKEYSKKNPGTTEYVTLFISIGKNKRVFPGDLTKLFCSTLNISNADIGNIKVLDNYSFLDISPEHADKAIEQLNSSEYRGRRITVNHARKKSGE